MNLKKIIGITGLLMLLCTNFIFGSDLKNSKFPVVYSDNMLETKRHKLDINRATKEEMSNYSMTLKQVNSIIEYREITGGFLKIEELKRIKGIGDSTYKKLSEKLEVKTPIKKKKIKINVADEKTLGYFGFSKTEIKKIVDFRNENKRIRSNLDIMKLITKEKYNKYKDMIIYER